MSELPPNVYRVAQRRFDAIPGSPWVYWVPNGLRSLFETNQPLGSIADVGQGMTTADNERFLRFWWEPGFAKISFAYTDDDTARTSHRRWFPYMKGGGNLKWYGHQDLLINWLNGGTEIKMTGRATIRNSHRYFQPGITWSSLGSKGFSARVMPAGFLFDDKGSSCGIDGNLSCRTLGFLNSSLASYLLGLLNPSVSFQSGDISRLPVLSVAPTPHLDELVTKTTLRATKRSFEQETTFDFVTPPRWDTGIADQAAAAARLAALEAQINDEVYRLYGISDEDRATIEAELAGGARLEREDDEGDEGAKHEDRENGQGGEAEAAEGVMTREELAVRWISYAVGAVLGRFQPGVRGALGSAIYHRDDFAIGSLPAPDEAEFDDLVGPPERFAHVDAEGGRHLFSAEVEAGLSALALPDGIAVLDEGHPRDLVALVERALGLMLDEGRTTDDENSTVYRQSEIVNQVGGDLRAFLSRDFFTKWHLRWYRKRPVYWPLQSAKRSYGFVLFHERVDRLTLYTLQRDYLDYKINAVRQQVADLNQAAAMQSGASRRASEREAARATALLDELTEFAKTMERIVRGGYEPEANWIDDGVILRLAPLWDLLPLWRSEPKKYWERLERGDFDWSHIAMKYWPERVREKCNTNKSFAIAHGLAD